MSELKRSHKIVAGTSAAAVLMGIGFIAGGSHHGTEPAPMRCGEYTATDDTNGMTALVNSAAEDAGVTMGHELTTTATNRAAAYLRVIASRDLDVGDRLVLCFDSADVPTFDFPELRPAATPEPTAQQG